MREDLCPKCGHEVSTAYCGHCGQKLGGDFAPINVLRSLVEAPIVAAWTLPVTLLPSRFAERVKSGEVDLKVALQVFGAALAASIVFYDLLNLKEDLRASVITSPGYETAGTLISVASFYLAHFILSAPSDEYAIGRPLTAFLCYLSLAVLLVVALTAAAIFVPSPEAAQIRPLAIVVVLAMAARCLRRVYRNGYSSLLNFLVLAITTIAAPSLALMIIVFPVIAVLSRL